MQRERVVLEWTMGTKSLANACDVLDANDEAKVSRLEHGDGIPSRSFVLADPMGKKTTRVPARNTTDRRIFQACEQYLSP